LVVDSRVVEGIVASWAVEGPVVDETTFTTWAERGWHSWNPFSPEREFCEFGSHLVTLLRPRKVVETGAGQGYMSRRLATALRPGAELVCFEQDDAIRARLQTVPFFQMPHHRLADAATPTASDLADAELTVLDCDGPLRLVEVRLWHQAAPPGAVLLVHDAGNGHPQSSRHCELATELRDLQLPGLFLRNPRGGFVGVKDGRLPFSVLCPYPEW
jgi:hypothetical protein